MSDLSRLYRIGDPITFQEDIRSRSDKLLIKAGAEGVVVKFDQRFTTSDINISLKGSTRIHSVRPKQIKLQKERVMT